MSSSIRRRATAASCATKCTTAAPGNGRTVTIADSEFLQQRLRKLTKTRTGRARVRERVVVEHSLAHLGRRQGRRARYRGVRKNLFDVRRNAAVQDLETVHRRVIANDNHATNCCVMTLLSNRSVF